MAPIDLAELRERGWDIGGSLPPVHLDDDLPAGSTIRLTDDAIFGQTQDIKGLIVDVRSNGGGEDAFVLELASQHDSATPPWKKVGAFRECASRRPEPISWKRNRGRNMAGPAVSWWPKECKRCRDVTML